MHDKLWVDVTTGRCYSTRELMALYPTTSFPVPFAPPAGYAPLTETLPDYDAATHRAVPSETAEMRDGKWSRTISVVALTPEEVVAARKRRTPAGVTRRQARQALLLAGLLDGVQSAIDGIPDATQRALAQIEWDDSQMFERDRPLLIQLAGALGLDDEALDNLFIQAGSL